ncbi:hypothetical protein, conserved [Babesia ovata]|uniref:Extracellular matrix-binding ebh n=1 Tax=Babesia ovata TaxID=189622 RepID=A0A2H6KJI8_9APIC|nr:uncharacterized protein BOVATA_046320 [Babesia ovata]GBE63139.1 hypothetical protein, conserved [Babesia ovata]
MHNGSNGLQNAITQVSAALRAWDQDVTHKTRTLIHLFKDLKIRNIVSLRDSLSSLSGCKAGEVADSMQICVDKAGDLQRAFRLAARTHKSLDPELRNKLKDDVHRVETEVEKFCVAASNSELRAVVLTVKQELDGVESFVKQIIEGAVRQLEKDVLAEISSVQGNIEQISRSADNLSSAVDDWLQDATSAVKLVRSKAEEYAQNFDKDYKQEVDKIITTIADDVREVDKAAAEELQALETLVQERETVIQRLIDELANNREKLSAAAVNQYGVQMRNAAKGLKKTPPDLEQKIKHAQKALNLALQNAEHAVKKPIAEANKIVREAVEKVTRKAEEITKSVTAKTKNLTALAEKIRNQNNALSLTIDADKYGVNSELDALEDIIKEIDSDIKNHVEGINADVATLRSSTTRAISTAKQKASDTITEVQSCVDGKIKAATESIQDTAKRVHYTTINEMFKKLETKVETHARNIEEIINKDLSTGVKGLMRQLKGKVDGQADQQPPPQPNSNLLDGLSTAVGDENPQHWEKVKKLSEAFKNYADPVLNYIEDQFKSPSFFLPNVSGKKSTDESDRISTIHTALSTLLSHLRDQKHFDHRVPGMLQNLTTSVQALHSTGFANPAYPVLDAFPKSLVKFVEQLEKGYVNRYEGHEEILLYNYVSKKVTPEGEKCAKVFLTLLEILNSHLRNLYDKCIDGKDCKDKCIRMYDNEKNKRTANPLGDWFQRRGFKVSDDNKTQNGELRNDENVKGEHIKGLLVNGNGKYVFKQDNKKEDAGPLRTLFRHLLDYYKVPHMQHIASPISPSNIYQMLQWLLGLYFNPVYDKLKEHIKELFPKPKTLKDKPYSDIPTSQLTLPATTEIRHDGLIAILREVCLYSEDILVAILGHGHADGIYAVDFLH